MKAKLIRLTELIITVALPVAVVMASAASYTWR